MITLDPSAPEPPYQQIRERFGALIAQGELSAGDRMPTVRALADQLGLAVNTVARAYRELEAAGLIDTRGRAGSFVSGTGVEAEARAAAHEYAERIRSLGVDPAVALRQVRQALGD